MQWVVRLRGGPADEESVRVEASSPVKAWKAAGLTDASGRVRPFGAVRCRMASSEHARRSGYKFSVLSAAGVVLGYAPCAKEAWKLADACGAGAHVTLDGKAVPLTRTTCSGGRARRAPR
mgnify:CR=1 FL=1